MYISTVCRPASSDQSCISPMFVDQCHSDESRLVFSSPRRSSAGSAPSGPCFGPMRSTPTIPTEPRSLLLPNPARRPPPRRSGGRKQSEHQSMPLEPQVRWSKGIHCQILTNPKTCHRRQRKRRRGRKRRRRKMVLIRGIRPML